MKTLILVALAALLVGCAEKEAVGDSPAAVNGRHASPQAQAEKAAMRAHMDEGGESVR